MRKLYYPLRQLMETSEVLDKVQYSDSERMGTALLSYSRSLLEHLRSDSACAVLHMDSILSEKFNLNSLVEILDAILNDPESKLLDSDEERRLSMQTYLLALRSCYQHDALLHEESTTSGFRQILATALGAREDKVDSKSIGITLCALRSLAHEFMVRGDLDAAFVLYEDVLERQQMMLGEESSGCMVTQMGLCDVMARQGKSHEARRRFEQIIQDKKDKLGNYHPETLAALGAFAFFLTTNFT